MKCSYCNKKIKSLFIQSCKCNKSFCQLHKMPEDHQCMYNYFEENKKVLMQNNPTISFKKCDYI